MSSTAEKEVSSPLIRKQENMVRLMKNMSPMIIWTDEKESLIL